MFKQCYNFSQETKIAFFSSNRPKLALDLPLLNALKGQINQTFDFCYYSPIVMKCVRNDPNKHNMKFGSIESNISEIFAIKNCYFSD